MIQLEGKRKVEIHQTKDKSPRKGIGTLASRLTVERHPQTEYHYIRYVYMKYVICDILIQLEGKRKVEIHQTKDTPRKGIEPLTSRLTVSRSTY